MVDLADALKAEPPRAVEKKLPARKTFTMQGLRRVTLWGATAAGALLVAALTSRSEVGVQRIAGIVHGGHTQVATRTFDAQAETQRLAEAVRGLSANDEQIKSRLAAVERDMNDVTGAITKQIKASDATRPSDDGPSVTATAALTASLGAPAVAPPAGFASAPATIPPAAEVAAPAVAPRIAYGVDIGSGLTIQALRARWAQSARRIRSYLRVWSRSSALKRCRAPTASNCAWWPDRSPMPAPRRGCARR